MKKKSVNTTRGGNLLPLVLCAALALAIFGSAMFWLSMKLDTSLAIKQPTQIEPSVEEVQPQEEPVAEADETEDAPSLVDAAIDVATDEEVQESVMGRIKKWREDRKNEDDE